MNKRARIGDKPAKHFTIHNQTTSLVFSRPAANHIISSVVRLRHRWVRWVGSMASVQSVWPLGSRVDQKLETTRGSSGPDDVTLCALVQGSRALADPEIEE